MHLGDWETGYSVSFQYPDFLWCNLVILVKLLSILQVTVKNKFGVTPAVKSCIFLNLHIYTSSSNLCVSVL